MNRSTDGARGHESYWTRALLTDCVEILDASRVPVNAREREERLRNRGNKPLYPYFGATGQVGLVDGYLFDGESVLLGEDGAPFLDPNKNKAYVVDGKCWVNNH